MTPSPAEYGPIELHKASPGVSSPARLWHTTRASFIRPAPLCYTTSAAVGRLAPLLYDQRFYYTTRVVVLVVLGLALMATPPSITQRRPSLLGSDASVYHAATPPDGPADPPATLPPTLPRRTHNAASDSVDYVCEATFICSAGGLLVGVDARGLLVVVDGGALRRRSMGDVGQDVGRPDGGCWASRRTRYVLPWGV
ncbi:hypothetical protein BD626DRAFT_499769 [Schizophyllum amplum]|uniref:Uncharacterized protein n=1 Tax=Schizophyllum amplum TaxID=97359 RepID=A0A550CBA1_9AGAR|nr:hypothetical protein BD626DRAFT_499722 [Auriculariopsis ampla]TRM62073.1 hypothetical protein BD626DRAFT_499769 [Auriculariopsis ampla]